MWKPPFATITSGEVGPAVEPLDDATSLDFLRAIYRNPALPLSTRMRAAIAALPFEHPKLAVTAQIDADGDLAERLERAIVRSGVMPVLDHQPTLSAQAGLNVPSNRQTVD